MPSKHSTGRRAAAAGKQPSRRRTWLFRLGASIAVPVALLALLEGILRLANYGHPTTFFVRATIGSQEFHVSNDRFGFRFFPPSIARTPFGIRMRATKEPGTYRIFVFGESAAQGDPDPTFGFARYLEVLLKERYPGAQFEVICTAMTAINSHAILPIARECAGLEGDLWIVYMGNNEMVGPFGPSTVFGAQAPPVWLVRANLAARATRTGQLLKALVPDRNDRSSDLKGWGGLSMFQNNVLSVNDPRRVRAYASFAENLDDLLSSGRRAGVPVLLGTVASNLKDCAPFGSVHRPGWTDDNAVAWDNVYLEANTLEAAGDFQKALDLYGKAQALDDAYAELHFRIGRCRLALQDEKGAAEAFQRARDLDALGFRADTRINDAIRAAADRRASGPVYLSDSEAYLRQHSPSNLLGQELFYEHVHLNFEGNYLLARMFADQLAPLLPARVRVKQTPHWASAQLCDARLAVSAWDRYRVWMANFSRVSEPPFTTQLNDIPRAQFYMATLESLKARMNPAAEAETRGLYRSALRRAPDDPNIHGNHAQFLAGIGDLATAVAEQQRVCELLPHATSSHHKHGMLLVRQNDLAAATAAFNRALTLRPDYVPALNELGVIHWNAGRTNDALQCFKSALRLNPRYVEAHLNLGFMQHASGQFENAVTHYRNAAALQSQGPAALFCQAVELVARRQRPQAIELFRGAVWMNPGFWQARYLLGLELAGIEDLNGAQEQFAETVKLRPDFAKAHLNFGISLARQRKLDQAATEFETVLRLNAGNETARRHLDMVQSMRAAMSPNSTNVTGLP
jgi:tetratricopeptide (TPR) repeat protein